MSEPPDRIYLQWDEHPLAEITWCVDQVANEDGVEDVEYIRADLAKRLAITVLAWKQERQSPDGPTVERRYYYVEMIELARKVVSDE